MKWAPPARPSLAAGCPARNPGFWRCGLPRALIDPVSAPPLRAFFSRRGWRGREWPRNFWCWTARRCAISPRGVVSSRPPCDRRRSATRSLPSPTRSRRKRRCRLERTCPGRRRPSRGRLAHPSLEHAADRTIACWRDMERNQLIARLRDEIARYEQLRRGTSDERLLDEIERLL